MHGTELYRSGFPYKSIYRGGIVKKLTVNTGALQQYTEINPSITCLHFGAVIGGVKHHDSYFVTRMALMANGQVLHTEQIPQTGGRVTSQVGIGQDRAPNCHGSQNAMEVKTDSLFTNFSIIFYVIF